jgi:hypothetical protein
MPRLKTGRLGASFGASFGASYGDSMGVKGIGSQSTLNNLLKVLLS